MQELVMFYIMGGSTLKAPGAEQQLAREDKDLPGSEPDAFRR